MIFEHHGCLQSVLGVMSWAILGFVLCSFPRRLSWSVQVGDFLSGLFLGCLEVLSLEAILGCPWSVLGCPDGSFGCHHSYCHWVCS